MTATDRTCWTCGHRQKGTLTLLGHCWGWPDRQGDWPLEIKPTKGKAGAFLVDIGCSRWTDVEQDFDALKASGRTPAVSSTWPQTANLDEEGFIINATK